MVTTVVEQTAMALGIAATTASNLDKLLGSASA